MSDDFQEESKRYFENGVRTGEAELALAREKGDKQTEAKKLGELAHLYGFQKPGDTHLAVDYYEQAIPIAREIGDKALEADLLAGLGTFHTFTWDRNQINYPKASQLFWDAIALARELGDGDREGWCLRQLGVLHASQQDYPQALSHLERARALFHASNNSRQLGDALTVTASVYQRIKDYPQTISHLEQAISVYRSLYGDDGAWVALTFGELARVYYEMGDYEQAAQAFDQGLSISHRNDESQIQMYKRGFGAVGEQIAAARAKPDSHSQNRLDGKGRG